jgi:tetratricopeptide (TPR) repeat protein
MLAGTLLAANLSGQSSEELKQKGIQGFEAGQFAAAKEAFKLLLQRVPCSENYAYEAIAELRMGEVRQAIAHSERAAELGYAPASAHYNLGLAYQLLANC